MNLRTNVEHILAAYAHHSC